MREVAATVKDVAAMIADAKQAADLVTKASADLGQQATDLQVRGGAVHRDHRKDRRMTMASMPGLPRTPSAQRYAIRSYSMPAKVFHWLTVALVVVMVSSAVIAKQLNDGSWSDTLFMLHKTTGVITLAVVLLRLCYRIMQWWTDAATGGGPAAPFLHWLLYAVIILVPLAGLGRDFRLRLARDPSRASRCLRSGRSTPAMRMSCSRSTPISRSACWRWWRCISASRCRTT